MKYKRILKFYFAAERVERAIDNLILKLACGSANPAVEAAECAEKIMGLISAKRELSGLWAYLDGVMAGFCGEDRQLLKGYAYTRGTKNLDDGKRRAYKRVAVRFFRRARRMEAYSRGLEIMNGYYCFLRRT